jgi:hypothetical protein
MTFGNLPTAPELGSREQSSVAEVGLYQARVPKDSLLEIAPPAHLRAKFSKIKTETIRREPDPLSRPRRSCQCTGRGERVSLAVTSTRSPGKRRLGGSNTHRSSDFS